MSDETIDTPETPDTTCTRCAQARTQHYAVKAVGPAGKGLLFLCPTVEYEFQPATPEGTPLPVPAKKGKAK